METVSCDKSPANALPTLSSASSSINTPPRDSAALRRLMDEVRCEEMITSAAAAYNRQHNRHNR
jgi:hypothetical protein